VSGHIIIALIVVLEPRLALLHQPVEKLVEIVTNGRVSILVNGNPSRGVLYKKMQNPSAGQTGKLLLNQVSNQMEASGKWRQLNVHLLYHGAVYIRSLIF
jgi:hypothetical protein